MIKKVHRRLTFLCSGITIAILVILSLCCLAVSERNLRESHFLSFEKSMNTLLSNLENQTVITHEWLSKMEGNGTYLISVRDNGREFLWGTRKEEPKRQALFDAGWEHYDSHFQIESADSPAPAVTTFHTEFSFSYSDTSRRFGGRTGYFYGCAAFSVREHGTLSILILKPLEELQIQIWKQRILFGILMTGGSVLLFLFSWYFTMRLLVPVEENRRRQLEFISAASHELRTPLSAILSAADACQRATPSEQTHFFSVIHEEGLEMTRLLSDLLLLAGQDQSSFSLKKERCEADTLLLGIYETYEILARREGALLSVSLPDDALTPILCDEGRIRQVLSILLHNALSHTPRGTRIQMEVFQTESQTVFRVQDNGPGIPEDRKDKIFERFFQMDSSHSQKGHFGLGLAIAAQLVEAHHGKIWVEDAPGGGAVFLFSLPKAIHPIDSLSHPSI